MLHRFFWSWLRQWFFRKSTPATNSRRQARRPSRLGLEWLEDRAVPAVASFNSAFIASSYQALLGRPVDPNGLSYWQGQLNQGASYADIVTGIASSVEYRTHELTSLYQTYLGRSLDDGGRAYWLSLLNAGASWEQVEAGIAGSTEHFHYVGQTIQSDITNLFQNTLGRSLDAVGSQYFANLYNSGASLTTIASQVLNSTEARTHLVTDDYQIILGRAADAGMNYWVNQLAAGASRIDVLAGFFGSTEFLSDLSAFLPTASSDPNAAASAFLNSPSRAAANPQPPTLKLTVPTGVVSSDPTVTVVVTAGSGGMPTSVAIDVDLNNNGTFTDANESNRYVAPVINGVATIKLTNFIGDNHLVRARAVAPNGQQGVSQAVIIRTVSGDPINPAVPAQLASLPAQDAAVAAIAKARTNATSGSQLTLNDPNNTFTESEPNDTPAQANIVTLSSNDTTTIIGSISSATDVDYFQFTLTTKSGVFFDVNSIETGLSTTLDSGLVLYDSSGTNVLDSDDNGYDFNTGWPLQASQVSSATGDSSLYEDLNPGTYYIEVLGMNNTTGAYNLLVTPDTNYSNTPPQLSSLSGAPATFYLDFLGYSDPGGSDWNNATGNAGGGSPFTIAPYRFAGNSGPLTPGEQLAMQNIWEVVSEDYSPFDINVTTVDPGLSAFVAGKAMRVVFGGDQSDLPNDNLGTGTVGVGLENSFATGPANDLVCFVFADDPTFFQSSDSSATIVSIPLYLGDIASHEAGHTFGLYHYDILPNNLPIMEWQGPSMRATWWVGMTRDESSMGGLAPFFQDDMAVISGAANGFGYRPDSFGTSIATATPLTATGNVYSASGVIDQPTSSQDFFSFGIAASGPVTISVDVNPYINDLNSQVSLFNASGTLVANDNNPASYDSTISQTLGAGTYYVEVSSKGGNGEAGQYDLLIAVPPGAVPPPPVSPPPVSPPPGSGGPPPAQITVSTVNIYAPNQTSDMAHDFGSLSMVTIFSYDNLSITSQTSGQFEWYKWEASSPGTFYSTLTTTSGGPLEMHLFTLPNGVLTELSSNTGGTLSTRLTQGQAVYIEVKGENTAPGVKSTGIYNLDVALEPN